MILMLVSLTWQIISCIIIILMNPIVLLISSSLFFTMNMLSCIDGEKDNLTNSNLMNNPEAEPRGII